MVRKEELTGRSIKQALNNIGVQTKSARYYFHNKHSDGGNFGITIELENGETYELAGFYNPGGHCYGFRFGIQYLPNSGFDTDMLDEGDLDTLIDLIVEKIEIYQETM